MREAIHRGEERENEGRYRRRREKEMKGEERRGEEGERRGRGRKHTDLFLVCDLV
jgi:hypothetical protein